MAAAMPAPAGASAKGTPEFAVKATYLHKLAAFVQWPAGAFESAGSPIYFCVAGASPFGPLLQQAVDDQRIGAHPILIRYLARADRAAGCHVLYLASPSAAAEGLRTVRASPVLTVTDSAFQDRPTGIVHFVLKDSRVRFQIDDGAAEESGLTLSSKLLSLALATRTGP
jgi:hypothetical protein